MLLLIAFGLLASPIMPPAPYKAPEEDEQGLYAHVALPQPESLRDCMERTIPFYRDVIVPDAVAAGKTVLVASSENAIRGLLMHLCDVPVERIADVEIPTGVPLLYDPARRRIRLLDDGEPDPLSRYDFGAGAELLFGPEVTRALFGSPDAPRAPLADLAPRVVDVADAEVVAA